MLLVDDHPLFLEGLAALFAHEDDFEVAGQAQDARGALVQARALRPDLILMDIDLPGEDGIAALRQIKVEMPEINVVMLTVHDDTEKMLASIKAGAQGYLAKSVHAEELLSELRGIAEGEAALSRRMAARILEEFRRSGDAVEPEASLTSRELEILELVADRLSNREIAGRLVISEHTVKNHLKNILSKLQLRSRREAAAYGVTRGWIRPDRHQQV